MSARDAPEHRLSHFCGQLLERILLEPCWFSAQDHSGASISSSPQTQMNWRAKQKWQGIKPSQLDWRVIQLAPCIYAEIELKVGYGKPSDGQFTTMRLLTERGIPTGCAWSLRQFYGLLDDAGFRLHANAWNILLETEARYEAACFTAKAKAATPRKRKAPTAKASSSEIRSSETFRARMAKSGVRI